MAAEKIFLIGMMGSGKSFWTKKIAKWIKAAGYDLDSLIEMNEKNKRKAEIEKILYGNTLIKTTNHSHDELINNSKYKKFRYNKFIFKIKNYVNSLFCGPMYINYKIFIPNKYELLYYSNYFHVYL